MGYCKATAHVKKEIWISQMIPPGWLLQMVSRRKSTCVRLWINIHVQALHVQLEGGYGLLQEKKFQFIRLLFRKWLCAVLLQTQGDKYNFFADN